MLPPTDCGAPTSTVTGSRSSPRSVRRWRGSRHISSTTPWPAAATRAERALGRSGLGRAATWSSTGRGSTRDGATAVALLDDWAETVPSTKHTTHAAFGFDAPRARAAQAILLAVPPDEQVALTADALPGIVLSTRMQAHARTAQPDQPRRPGRIAVPTSMVLGGRPRRLATWWAA